MSSRNISFIMLAVNLALLATIAYMALFLKGGPPAAQPVTRMKSVTNTITQIAVRKINSTNLLAALANRSLNWATIESTNYTVYISNLRTIGCPEETVRDIILTDVAKLYAKRRAALRSSAGAYKFWQTADVSETHPEIEKQLRALEKEERALIKELLGVDLQNEMAKYWNDDDSQERMYGFLAPEKRERVQALQTTFDELEQEVYARSHGVMLDEDQEQLKRIQKQREQELAKILTPEEFDEYELRNSSTANGLRAQMTGFAPTEDEFRKVFRLQKTFDDEFNQAFDSSDEKQMEIKASAQQQAQEALNEEIKKVLGDQRYSEYQRTQDGDYKTLVQVAERFELPKEMATTVYGMKQDAEKARQQIETNANLTDEQRQRALAAIALETERKVAEVMGDKIFKAYRKSGAQWIQNLNGSGDLSAFPNPPLPPLPNQ